MKKIAFAIVALLFCVTFADAAPVRVQINTGRRFPVATAVGRTINRVVGFPFRVGAAALGFQPNFRRQVIVNTPAAQIRVGGYGRQNFIVARQNFVVRRPAAIVVRQPVVIRRHNNVNQIRILRENVGYGYNRQQFVLRETVYPTTSQQIVVGQLGTNYEQQAQEVADPQPTAKVILREVAQPTYTQRVILREVATNHCGAVSQFRVSRFRY